MRNLAIFGALDAGTPAGAWSAPRLAIDGMVVRNQLVRTPDPDFEPTSPANARQALIRVHAFSCNFRDKGFMLRLQQVPASRFFVIGSEFMGTVVEVGTEVHTLRPGDRVIGQNHFAGRDLDADGAREGIPTNQASKEYQVFHEKKLIRIPSRMSDETGAGFSIGAQTAYSMVRKLAPEAGAKVLVTSATSNTSLFAVAALKQRGAHVHVSTTSRSFDERLRSWGADEVIHVGGEDGSFRDSDAVTRLAEEIGWFDHVIDPYFDLHLEKAVEILGPFGKYTTCGLVAQNPGAAKKGGVKPINAERVMLHVMTKNLSIIGNCIGIREDLEQALADFDQDRFACLVDSVFGGEDTTEFLDRTYNDRARLGKVIFRY